ncbi:MAG: PKD domain-containing protein [Thermoplasmata archaeon]|nr:PKD domain-containing protein [Thermoplasmata archaeon]
MTRGGGPEALRSAIPLLLVAAAVLVLPGLAGAAYTLDIEDPSDGAHVEGILTIRGTLEMDGSPEPDAVSVRLNGTWRDAVDVAGEGDNWTEWSYAWRTGSVPNGTYYLTAAVRQGFSYSDQVTVGVTIDNEMPTAEIVRVSPRSIVEGDVVLLEGEATDLGSGDQVAEYIWRSDIDGHIGSVGSLTCFLSPGEHTISLRVRTDIGTRSEKVQDGVSVSVLEDIALPGLDLRSSYHDPEPIDVEDIGRGWFVMTGERDSLSKVVPFTGHLVTGMVVGDGMIYAVLDNGTAFALDTAGLSDGVQGEMLDSADVVWTVDLGSASSGAVALRGNDLFIGTDDGYVYALDARTGTADAWPAHGSFFYAGNESICADGFTFLGDIMVFSSYSNAEASGTLWALDIEGGSIVDHAEIHMLPLQRPIPVGDHILLPVFNLTDGILLFEVTRQDELVPAGAMDIPDYVMGVSAGDGALVVMARPSEEGHPGRIYLFDHALELREVANAGLAFFDPAAIGNGLLVISGTPSDAYTGEEYPYVYGRGYLLVLDMMLQEVGTIELNGPPSTAPTMIGDTAIVSSHNGTLYAVDLVTFEDVPGWPIHYEAYGRNPLVQSLGTTTIMRFGDALAFGSHDTVLYTLGGEVIRPVGEILYIDPPGPGGEPLEAYYGTPIRFEGMGSSLVSKGITGFRWHSSVEGVISEEESFTAVLGPGTHVISFTVVDEDNMTSIPVSATYVVHPNSLPVAALANQDDLARILVDEPLILDLSASSDADGDDITWIVAFGDGVVETAYRPEADHVYRDPGTYQLSITPVDEHDVCGEPLTMEVRVGEPETEDSSISAFCIVFILVLVFVIALMGIVYVRTRVRSEPDLEEEPAEAPAISRPRQARKPVARPRPAPVRVRKPTADGQAARPVPAVSPRPMKRPDVLAGYEEADVSLDELTSRLDALVAHKQQLERYVDEDSSERRRK